MIDDDVLIVDLFLSRVSEDGDATALVLESGAKYSYSALAGMARPIGACVLAQLSAAPRHSSDLDTALVCVMLDRHAALVASMIGVLLAGAAYVPVDPAFPAERQAYIFEHSKCGLLIADEASYANALSLGVVLPPVVVVSPTGAIIKSPVQYSVDGAEEGLAAARKGCYGRAGGGLMYVLYTSGSTGKPKGVMVGQFGVTNIVSWFASQILVKSTYKVLGLTTACFDISVLEIYMPLISGATLVLADSASQKDPFRLLDVIREHKVDVFQATPTTYEMMLATGWRGDASMDLLVGGEAFRPSLIRLVRECRSFRNVYGPTETTIWSSCFELRADYFDMQPATASPAVPIGAPIGRTDFYLVDAAAAEAGRGLLLVDAAAGEEGELLIGGAGVARGYLHAPDLTAGRFVRNPFGAGLVYRTGDLVKRTPSGDYVFVRRLDDQVKIDGFRIELAEVEAVYGAHPLVEQAVVLVRLGKLAAYLKLRGAGGERELADIRAHASRALTHYMLPRYTVVVQAFPQTANGKLDRKALPDPVIVVEQEPVEEEAEAGPAGVRSPARDVVALVLAVMRAERGSSPRPVSTFAAIGIDSLAGVFFIRALSDALGGVQVTPGELYGPGVTVRSFGEGLFARVKDRPEVLARVQAYLARQGVPSSEESLEEGASEDGLESHYDEALGASIAANVRFFQGLRGLYTLMVLYDHFGNPLRCVHAQYSSRSGSTWDLLDRSCAGRTCFSRTSPCS